MIAYSKEYTCAHGEPPGDCAACAHVAVGRATVIALRTPSQRLFIYKQPELPNEVPARQLQLTPASRFRPARVKWGWDKRMPVGELTLVPGREGIGKSLFLAWMCAQLTNGNLPGEFYGQPRGVLYAASEDSWNYTITPRLIAAGADLSRVYRMEISTSELGGRLTLPLDCNLVPEAARAVDAAALMLDPIISLIDDKLSTNQSRELRRALEPLRECAEKAGIMVPALMHFNKAVDTDILTKIPGARAWGEVARSAFALVADAENNNYVASQIKNNLGRLDLPHLTYEIREVFVDTEDGPASVGRLVWTGETSVGVEEIMARRPERASRDTSTATDAVVDYVNELSAPAETAVIAAQFQDMAYDSVKKILQRAAKRRDISNPTRGWYGPRRDT